MFFTEPMVLCIALYASFIFGILFLQLEVFPIIFREQRGANRRRGGARSQRPRPLRPRR